MAAGADLIKAMLQDMRLKVQGVFESKDFYYACTPYMQDDYPPGSPVRFESCSRDSPFFSRRAKMAAPIRLRCSFIIVKRI